MWFWAGAHKILSPEWPMIAWNLLENSNVDPHHSYLLFTWMIPLAEIFLAGIAIFRPHLAAIVCVILHLGIVVFLSPLFLDFNVSVIPWNVATAVVGFALFWNAKAGIPAARWERVFAVGCLLLPFGFYGGWIDRGLAFVLYSGNTPRAAITNKLGVKILSDWGYLGVPFPSERRHFLTVFEKTANVGDKLHIMDRRPWLTDQFFVMGQKRIPTEISRQEFLIPSATDVKGTLLDDPLSIFMFKKHGTKMLARVKGGAVYAIEFNPKEFSPAILSYLKGLPNLEQIQLANCDLNDEDMRHLSELYALVGVGLSNTRINDRGLSYLTELKNLRVIEHQGSNITPQGLGTLNLLE